VIELLIFTAVTVGLIWFSYSAGKNKEKKEIQEEVIDAIESARKARLKLNDPDVVNRLLNTFRK